MSDGHEKLLEAVQKLSIGLALVDQRMASIEKLEDNLERIDKHLIKFIGLDGNNGMVSDIRAAVEANTTSVSANTGTIKEMQAAAETKKKVGKAWMAGYLAAASGTGGVIGLLAKYLA